MAKKNIKDILEKVESADLAPEEEQAAKLWLFQLNSNKELHLSDEKLCTISDQMWSVIAQSGQVAATKRRSVPLWARFGIAAAVSAMLISAGIWFYQSAQKDRITDQLAYANDVAPGKSGATLTLADGKKIRLTDAANGQLAQEAGVTITKTADGKLIYHLEDKGKENDQINTLSTVNGETYQLRLPDGSSVWLNAASSLSYPLSFANRQERRVVLHGEGYFEIAKDSKHPFVVQTDKQEVEVLGTHFNINAYPDEAVVATTLLEGSVRLVTGIKNQMLKPGEQAINDQGAIRIRKVDPNAVTDWKNDEFFLDKMDFRAAMRKIARWYNIEVIYNGSVPDNLEAGGWIPRNSSLSDVLRSIESTGQVHFKIDGRKLYVSE